MSDAALKAPVPLARSYQCDEFDCGVPSLNEYLTRFAWVNQQSGAARTYVACRGKRVFGEPSFQDPAPHEGGVSAGAAGCT